MCLLPANPERVERVGDRRGCLTLQGWLRGVLFPWVPPTAIHVDPFQGSRKPGDYGIFGSARRRESGSPVHLISQVAQGVTPYSTSPRQNISGITRYGLTAIIWSSTCAAPPSAATCTVARAGGSAGKYLRYTSLNLGKSLMSAI